MVKQVVSCGQTGVDRAALDVALELGIPCGGWCPKGRRAEDGALDARYPLEDTPIENYAQRTEWNVRDSDGTLILSRGRPIQGTALTAEFAVQHNRPCLVVDLTRNPRPETIRNWIKETDIRALNVAGPRDSRCPGIYQEAAVLLKKVFDIAL